MSYKTLFITILIFVLALVFNIFGLYAMKTHGRDMALWVLGIILISIGVFIILPSGIIYFIKNRKG